LLYLILKMAQLVSASDAYKKAQQIRVEIENKKNNDLLIEKPPQQHEENIEFDNIINKIIKALCDYIYERNNGISIDHIYSSNLEKLKTLGFCIFDKKFIKNGDKIYDDVNEDINDSKNIIITWKYQGLCKEIKNKIINNKELFKNEQLFNKLLKTIQDAVQYDFDEVIKNIINAICNWNLGIHINIFYYSNFEKIKTLGFSILDKIPDEKNHRINEPIKVESARAHIIYWGVGNLNTEIKNKIITNKQLFNNDKLFNELIKVIQNQENSELDYIIDGINKSINIGYNGRILHIDYPSNLEKLKSLGYIIYNRDDILNLCKIRDDVTYEKDYSYINYINTYIVYWKPLKKRIKKRIVKN